MNIPPPKLVTTLPSGPNLYTGSIFESRHSSPNRAGSANGSHLIRAQTWRPSRSIVALPTAPSGFPPGSWAQPSTMRYGFGRAWASTVHSPPDGATRDSAAAKPTANETTDPSCRACAMILPSVRLRQRQRDQGARLVPLRAARLHDDVLLTLVHEGHQAVLAGHRELNARQDLAGPLVAGMQERHAL